MKKLLLYFILIFFPILNFAQQNPLAGGLSGTYLIGSSQPAPFKTLTSAVNIINTVGVAGPVVFLLDNTTFTNATGESFPIKINQFAGTSTINTLTIKPNLGKKVTITSQGINSYTENVAALQLDGADNIIIDGSNVANGISRDLSIENAESRGYISRTVIWLSSRSGNSVDNIRIANTKLKMVNRNGAYALMSGILSAGATVDLTSTSGAINKKLVVTNNEFINLRSGITIRGASNALKSQDLAVSLNTFGTEITGQRIASPIEVFFANNFSIVDNIIDGFGNVEGGGFLAGIRIQESSNYSVKRNTIKGLRINDSSKPSYGLLISGATQNAVISENIINDLENLSISNIIQGVGIETTPSSTGISLVNNFISKIFGGGPSTNSGHGIYVTLGGQGMKIYHNTVAMNVQQPGWSTAFTIKAGTNFDVRNNSFTNVSIPPSEYNETNAIRAISASVFATLDNNNYFANRVAGIGDVHFTTLAEWKTATGKDQNSKNINPTFVSLTDLHLQSITANAELDNAGANLLTVVPTDIDGQTRTATPDIGADEFSMPVALDPEPASQSTALNFTNVTASGFKINWTNGPGSNRIVVIRSGSAVNSSPLDATAYTASTIYGSGSQIGTGNYVVYNGNANTVTVTGLSAATTYYVSVYEYNGTAPTANYLITNPLIGSKLTLNADLGWQITKTNTLNTITFDSTVSGVNNGSYLGTGFTPAPASGQLNSNSWSLNGFKDGAIYFGGINTNPGFGLGTSIGSVSKGGIYAFKTSGNNTALGIQPTARDFTPGEVTLRFQNQTSAPITSISIGYKVFVYNDQAASNSFNFSHSANNTIFTEISELDVISPATADVTPSWKASYRVATITGINIPANGFYYLKWTGDEVMAGSAYDEFALDDIVLSANPTTIFPTFDGVAENFSVHGDATLSGNTTVNGDLKFTAGKLSVNDKTLTIGGNVINTTAGGIKGSANSNISVIGTGNKIFSFDQSTPGVTNLFKDFSIPFAAGANNTVTIANEVQIYGSLNVGLDQKLDLGINQLKGSLSTITINGTVTTQNESTTPFPASKTWGGNGILHLNATSTPQKLVAGTYTNLTLSSTGGTTANASVTVTGILDLPSVNPSTTAGSLSMADPFVLTMGPDGTNTGIGDVTGIISRNTILPNVLYTFGHKYSSILFPAVGTLPEWISVQVVIGQNNWRPGAIKRYYDITQFGALNTKAIIREHYLDSELNGNIESKLVNWGYKVGQTTPDFEQGRSNINTEENWVEVTNANIGSFFESTFDKVYITLDQTEASVLRWNGEQDNAWNTLGNWTNSDGTKLSTPSFGTKVIIPNVSPKPQPTLNSTTQVLSIEIEADADVNSAPNDVLEIYGTSGAWANNGGTFNPPTGTGKVIFKTLDATISGSTTFHNLEIAASASLRALEGNYMSISGNLVNNGLMSVALLPNTIEFVGANQIIPLPGGQDRNGYHHLTISGTNTVFPLNLNVRGNLIMNQPVNFKDKTINLSGDTKQMIGGTAAINFNNLTVNKEIGAVVLADDITVAGTLNLQKGNLIIDDKNLTLGQNAVAGTFSATNMIVADGIGFVRRPFSSTGSYFFPIGEMTSNPAYSPVSVNVTAGSFSDGNVSVSVVDAIHPNNNSAQNHISRYWNVKQQGISNAVATITANYVNAELLSPADTMIAAQLTGTFNAATNPWKRFSPLSGLTLTATGATLTNEVSVFTGIKGGDFTAVINGGDTTCEDQTVILTAEVTGGDMPYTYLWSSELEPNLGIEATLAPAEFIGTKSYTLAITDANGRKTTVTKSVTTLANAIAGTLSGNQTVCFGYTPNANVTLSENSAGVLYWQRSENESFLNPITINNTTTTLSSAEAGQITGRTYFRAAIDNGSCSAVFTDPIEISTKTTVWIDGAWSDGRPESNVAAVIAGDYSIAENINACSLTIIDSNVTIPAGYDVIIDGALIVDEATFKLESNTNLVQKRDELNYGNVTVERESSKLYRLDYTMWGSPVTGTQTLKEFSPKTFSNRFYIYNSSTDLFNTIVPTTNGFTRGQGYLIRMPDNHTNFGSTVPATSWTGQFVGIPNNGNISVVLDASGEGYNMISNPYASMIDANIFLTNNASEIEGTLYFWRRRNNVPTGTEGTTAYYATYTLAGGTAVATASESSEAPNGFIQVGQGFLVQKKATSTSGNVSFTNTMRSPINNDNQFFKTSNTEERNRIWLNVSNTAGEFGQTLVAYMAQAENGVDRTDGKYLNDGSTALTSWLDDSEYIIQGRAPFTSSDIVSLNFKTIKAGNYTIALDHVDGLFSGAQNIYLHDKVVGLTHNLKADGYTFETQAGSFNSRFELAYENGTLVVDNPVFDSSSVVLYKKEGNLTVRSKGIILKEVEVFDLAGRLVATAKNINSNEVSIKMNTVNQVLIVKITSTDGRIISKKMIN